MTTVQDILTFVETIAPRYMKMDWDNVGLLCGSAAAPVTRVLVALDPFPHVCREAADWGAELIITHHPLIFRPLTSVTEGDPVGDSILTLCRNGISAINAHTNLDQAPGGVNDVLAQALGLSDVKIIAPCGQDSAGLEWGLIHQGQVPEQTLADFLSTVKSALGCDRLRYCDGGRPVHRVAVGGGSCSDGIREVLAAGCDTFVTADVRYNGFWDAKALGLNLIDAGHFHTENPVVAALAAKIAGAFPDIQVKISETHADCMKFY